jgi:hypothetical protein
MRRWLGIATLTLGLLAMPVWAQRHGGGGGGAHFASGGSHSSGAVRSGSSGHISSSSSSYRGAISGVRGSGYRGSGVRVLSGNPNYRRRVYGPGYYYPYGLGYPYYSWYADPLDSPSDYQDGDDQSDGQSADSSADYSGPYRDDSGLQSDVQALSGKVDRLQADVEARNRPRAELQPATALVFRDQHVEEVHNYAISGGTIWVFGEQAAKKIPLTQLDLDATVKMNDDRGVDFQVPEPAMSIQIVR